MSPISLQDIIAGGTSIHWDEAVAIVEELCHVLIAASGDDASVPALEDVLIGASGDVSVRRTRGDSSPTAAGRALHGLLANTSDVPMPVRLFVMQSTVPDTHHSLREFAKALAYFGKPDRAGLIHDVYARSALVPRTAAASPLEPPSLPALESEFNAESREPQKKQEQPKKLTRKRIPRWAVAAAFVGIAGGATWMTSRGSSGTMTVGAKQMLAVTKDTLADLGRQVRETLGSQTAAPAQASAEPAAATAPETPRSRATTSTAPAPIKSRPVTSRREMLKLAAAAPIFLPPSLPTPEPVQEVTEIQADLEHVYSSDDADVAPPVLLYPHIRPEAIAVAASEGMNRMAVTVAIDGSVERVQLVDGPSRLPDMMLLSGAKTWKFAPATKDGQPVRYRTHLSWVGRP